MKPQSREMDLELIRGRYRARMAQSAADVRAAQALRQAAFRGRDGVDADAFDHRCLHVLVEELETARLVCCFRLMRLNDGRQIGKSYAAQHYELSALTVFKGPMVELGRFCIAKDTTDPDILRIAWAALTAYVDREGVQMLFGCSSFSGTEAEPHADAFAMLRESHLAPKHWLPKVKAPQVLRFAERFRTRPDRSRALRAMPPLLRTYLAMGGWVSDHAVVDRDLGTLHVFTGLEISAIPAARKRLLRTVAG
ncbi:MAG: GNAT family N-acyltransferase [Pseudomonadota bacterium]